MAGWRMRMGRKLPIGLVLATLGFAGAANASSRFDVGDESPVHAAVRMDFTIIIPEILTLRIDRASALVDPAFSNPAQARWSISVPAMQMTQAPSPVEMADLPLAQASGNAGTMAVGTAPEFMSAPEFVSAPEFEPAPALTDFEASGDIALAAALPTGSAPATVSLDTHPVTFLIALP